MRVLRDRRRGVTLHQGGPARGNDGSLAMVFLASSRLGVFAFKKEGRPARRQGSIQRKGAKPQGRKEGSIPPFLCFLRYLLFIVFNPPTFSPPLSALFRHAFRGRLNTECRNVATFVAQRVE